jgi:hypothetical protein
VAAPASRFDGRSIWDGGKRAVQEGRMLNVAETSRGEDWVLALPEWEEGPRRVARVTRVRAINASADNE